MDLYSFQNESHTINYRAIITFMFVCYLLAI